MQRNKRNRGRRIHGIAIAAVMLLGCGLVVAAPTPKVTVSVDVSRETVRANADGTQRIIEEPVTNVTPGDVLVYRLTANNVGKAAARNTRLQDPIPSGTVLMLSSISHDGASVMASIDDGETFLPFPILVETTAANGAVRQVAASPGSYTHLRWQLDSAIEPGSEKSVSFKVRVD